MTRTPATTNTRTRGITAVIEGFFAFMWFGWGSAEAPDWLRTVLLVGQVVAGLVVIVGIMTAVRSTGEHTPMADPQVRRRYNVVVGAEFGVLFAGAILLGSLGLGAWTAVWICAGVGIHFFPLARMFGDLWLVPLGVAVTAIAVVALVVGLATDVAPSTVTGPGAGLLLLVAAVAVLATSRPAGRRPDASTRSGARLPEHP
ncbi:hypothetical protein AB4Z09_22210 [Rhodococcus sp. TAF43]|uniref:hypothetical protein n=1 Tax=unclassified Rhodococcus (in: high G+C Gram-positive bacteria) TaxID=192944 RepID=UPI000E2D9735|nr:MULTISPECIES: hypothetical protein [unclassified Rhodococcus (in: high G+C Gram-positive bacteria)]QKT10223.1 hypothetical protein HUN07_05360 [Rhodococcus sp. W8901]RDI30358.1 hypothetical protein DEU38_106167 [Rhodococcus sp. AG1013]